MPYSRSVPVFFISLCMEQVWSFPTVASCQYSLSFGFWSMLGFRFLGEGCWASICKHRHTAYKWNRFFRFVKWTSRFEITIWRIFYQQGLLAKLALLGEALGALINDQRFFLSLVCVSRSAKMALVFLPSLLVYSRGDKLLARFPPPGDVAGTGTAVRGMPRNHICEAHWPPGRELTEEKTSCRPEIARHKYKVL